MLRNVPSSVRTALIMTLIVGLYFGVNTFLHEEKTVTTEKAEDPLTRVVTKTIDAGLQNRVVEIRGRTKAKRSATLRAETAGQVTSTPVEEGSPINEGTVLCTISTGVRNAGLAEAKAAFDKATIDYEAAKELSAQGFQSDAAVATAQAAYDLAEANLKRMQTDFARTRIKAPFDGILQKKHVEVGDLLSIGSPCATVAQLDPIIISGSVSEQDVVSLETGASAIAAISTGDLLEAKVTVISRAASTATRTFQVELEAANPNLLPDGLTAEAKVEIGEAEAHLIPRNSLLRSDTGELGVRIVQDISPDTNVGEVQFRPVSVLRDDQNGIWIAGLESTVDLIIRGQDYVKHGQMVEAAKPGDTLRTE